LSIIFPHFRLFLFIFLKLPILHKTDGRKHFLKEKREKRDDLFSALSSLFR